MVSFLKKLKSTCEAPLLFFIYLLLSLIPLGLLRRFIKGLAGFLGPHLPVSKKARRNIQKSLPDLTPQEQASLVKRVWQSLGLITAEFFYITRIIQSPKNFTLENAHHIQPILEKKSGAIFFSAHLGNWELSYAGLLQDGVPLSLIARRQRNPFAEWIINRNRKKQGIQMIPRTASGSRKLVKALKSGRFIGALFDTYDSDGAFLPFFDQPAKTTTALARVAIRLGYPLVPTQVIRHPNNHFTIRYHPPIYPNTTDTPESLMIQVNALIEHWIRENPDQWLWLHDRWKIKAKDRGQFVDKTPTPSQT